MQPAEILVELRRVLSPADAPSVLAALTEDKLVWESLQQPEFLHSILSEESTMPSSWSPAALALRPLGNRVSFADLTAEHIPGIEVTLRKQALEILESSLRNGQSAGNLTQAGLQALALRERRRKTQSWRGFLVELTSVQGKSPSGLVSLWQTPLACLYGMIPDKWDLLESLLPQDGMHPAIEWISHIILSNPLDSQHQVKMFHDLMSQLVVEYQVEWLRYLNGKGRFALAAGIADQLLVTDRDFLTGLEENFVVDHAEWVTASRKVLDNQLAATLYQVAGRPLQAGIYLDKTRKILQHWLVGSTLQMANVIDQEGKVNDSVYNECADLLTQVPVSQQLLNEALFAGGNGIISSRIFNLPANSQPMAAKVVQTNSTTHTEDAKGLLQTSRKIAAAWIDELDQNPDALKGQFVYDWNPGMMLESLTGQGLTEQAVQAAEKFLAVRSDDVNLLGWLGDTCHRMGEDNKAVNYRLRAILLNPDQPENLRKLAEIWEDRGDWQEALEERQKVIALTNTPSIDDELLLANCAISAGAFGIAKSVCEQILSNDPEHGMAFTLLGKTALAQGDVNAGIDYLSKAIVLIPEEYMPWFELAEAYRRKGDPQKMLETLRSAVLTAPDSAELHLALGKAYLENGQMSEALPFLRQSARLAPESVQIVLELAEALITLGYKQEALAVVDKARARWRVHDGLAYLHAMLLLKEGIVEDGLAVLEIALQSENPKAEWYLLYARTLIGDTADYLAGEQMVKDSAHLIKALQALDKAVALQPQYFEAQLLIAEVYLLRGDFEQAFGAYGHLIEQPEAVLDAWYWRIQAGLGRSALNLGQIETALASLENAVTANPESIGMNRCLAEAFADGNLADAAVSAADQALALAPDNVTNLTWYAHLMVKLNQLGKAVDALKTAVDFQPESVDLRLTLAESLLANGETEACRDQLIAVSETSSVSTEQYQKITQIYLSMGEPTNALSTLEKAVEVSPEPDAQVLFELAMLNRNAKKYDQSLELIQRAIHTDQSEAAFYVFQADLLDQLNRTQAALTSLEQALPLSSQNKNLPQTKILTDKSFFKVEAEPIHIHQRFTQLQQKAGNLEKALHHAEKAIELQADNAEYRFTAAELAAKILQDERAQALAAVDYDVAETDGPNPWIGGLYSLQAEYALERGDINLASDLTAKGRQFDPDQLRLLAAEVRVLTCGAEIDAAEDLYSQLWNQISPELKGKSVRADSEKPQTTDSTLLGVAEAAMGLHRWSNAAQLFECVIRRQPAQPLVLFRSARAMVRSAEWYLTAASLGVEAHLPDANVISDTAAACFGQTMQELRKLSSTPEIERWKVRGEAVFNPSPATVRGFASLSMNGADAAALVMALNRTGNIEGASQVGSQYDSHPLVCVQLAAVDPESKPEAAHEAALKAVSIDPKNPACQIALAGTSEKSGDIGRALEAVETALLYWPNEAGWQHLASRLALQSNEPEAAKTHLEKTFELMPANLEVALELGSVYQTLQDTPRAVGVLAKAVQIAPNHAPAWLDYGRALFTNKQYAEALKAATQAAQQHTDEAYQAMVLSGEILLAVGEERKAMDYARDAERIAPMEPEPRLLNCKILVARGKDKEALASLNKALDDLPGVLALETERARLVYKLQGAEAAVQVLQPLAEGHPENDQVISTYAAALAECGRAIEAEKAALLALRLNPQKAEIHLLLGRLFADSGQLDKSVHHLIESARISPNQSDAYIDLGRVYTTRRDFPEALEAYQQAMRTAPEDFRPFYQAGLILRDGKDYQAAETMLRRAANLAPNDVNIRRQLGAIVALNLVHNCQEANSCL